MGATTALAQLDQPAQQAAAEDWSYSHFLGRLLEPELAARRARVIETNLRFAGLPHLKRLEDFDFAFQPSKTLLEELATGRFLSEGRNVLLLGPQEAVESGACHDRITGEDVGPFGKGLIGSNNGCGVFFVTVADDLEEHCGAGLIETEITDFVAPHHRIAPPSSTSKARVTGLETNAKRAFSPHSITNPKNHLNQSMPNVVPDPGQF